MNDPTGAMLDNLKDRREERGHDCGEDTCVCLDPDEERADFEDDDGGGDY